MRLSDDFFILCGSSLHVSPAAARGVYFASLSACAAMPPRGFSWRDERDWSGLSKVIFDVLLCFIEIVGGMGQGFRDCNLGMLLT